jgi:hypothetical protein
MKGIAMKNILLMATLAASAASAQQRPQTPQPAPAPPATQPAQPAKQPRIVTRTIEPGALNITTPTFEFVSSFNVGPTVTGQPYSAEAVTESIQTLPDGNRIVKRTTTKQYRDREGRERREESAPVNAVFISDPVAKTSYTLRPDNKIVTRGAGSGVVYIQREGGAATTATQAGNTRFSLEPLRVTVGPEPGTAKVEDLGTRMIEGVSAKGSRATTTIPAGAIGNDREIEVVDERWVSAELQLVISTRHADPRTGETSYKLTNIQRTEPDKSLFEVPADYRSTADVIFQRKFE